jgi:hypothetical protein
MVQIGGCQNNIVGQGSFIGGGKFNNISGIYSSAFGQNADAKEDYSAVFGLNSAGEVAPSQNTLTVGVGDSNPDRGIYYITAPTGATGAALGVRDDGQIVVPDQLYANEFKSNGVPILSSMNETFTIQGITGTELEILADNVAGANRIVTLRIGKENTSFNCANIIFKYEGDGNTNNELCFAIPGTVEDVFSIRGDGNCYANQNMRVGDGSGSNPSYSFRNDTNSGMYRAGADILGFSVGGIGRLVLESSFLFPNVDNGLNLGKFTPLRRFQNIFLTNNPTVISDQTLKKDISDISEQDSVNFINELTPKKYNFIDTNSNREGYLHYGLMAQDVKTCMQSCNFNDFGGYVEDIALDDDGNQTGSTGYALKYAEFIPPMIKSIQSLSKTNKKTGMNENTNNSKNNIKNENIGLSFINELRPVTYDMDDTKHHGLVIDEVKSTLDTLSIPMEEIGIINGVSGMSGCYEINYKELVTPLIKAVQELSARVATLEALQS